MFDWNHAPDTRDTRPELVQRDRAGRTISRGYACACGQATITPTGACDACQTARNAPPAAPERLFEPAPAPMPGQIMGRWDPVPVRQTKKPTRRDLTR